MPDGQSDRAVEDILSDQANGTGRVISLPEHKGYLAEGASAEAFESANNPNAPSPDHVGTLDILAQASRSRQVHQECQ